MLAHFAGFPVRHIARGPAEPLQRQIDTLFNELGLAPAFDRELGRAGRDARFPANVYETESAYLVTVEVPGVKSDDLSLTLALDSLTFSAKRQIASPECARPLHQERQGLELTRTFTFATPVDPDRATSRLEAGVLTVTLPKASGALPRKIEVTVAS